MSVTWCCRTSVAWCCRTSVTWCRARGGAPVVVGSQGLEAAASPSRKCAAARRGELEVVVTRKVAAAHIRHARAALLAEAVDTAGTFAKIKVKAEHVGQVGGVFQIGKHVLTRGEALRCSLLRVRIVPRVAMDARRRLLAGAVWHGLVEITRAPAGARPEDEGRSGRLLITLRWGWRAEATRARRIQQQQGGSEEGAHPHGKGGAGGCSAAR
jgi:hypothetical protein